MNALYLRRYGVLVGKNSVSKNSTYLYLFTQLLFTCTRDEITCDKVYKFRK